MHRGPLSMLSIVLAALNCFLVITGEAKSSSWPTFNNGVEAKNGPATQEQSVKGWYHFEKVLEKPTESLQGGDQKDKASTADTSKSGYWQMADHASKFAPPQVKLAYGLGKAVYNTYQKGGAPAEMAKGFAADVAGEAINAVPGGPLGQFAAKMAYDTVTKNTGEGGPDLMTTLKNGKLTDIATQLTQQNSELLVNMAPGGAIGQRMAKIALERASTGLSDSKEITSNGNVVVNGLATQAIRDNVDNLEKMTPGGAIGQQAAKKTLPQATRGPDGLNKPGLIRNAKGLYNSYHIDGAQGVTSNLINEHGQNVVKEIHQAIPNGISQVSSVPVQAPVTNNANQHNYGWPHKSHDLSRTLEQTAHHPAMNSYDKMMSQYDHRRVNPAASMPMSTIRHHNRQMVHDDTSSTDDVSSIESYDTSSSVSNYDDHVPMHYAYGLPSKQRTQSELDASESNPIDHYYYRQKRRKRANTHTPYGGFHTYYGKQHYSKSKKYNEYAGRGYDYDNARRSSRSRNRRRRHHSSSTISESGLPHNDKIQHPLTHDFPPMPSPLRLSPTYPNFAYKSEHSGPAAYYSPQNNHIRTFQNNHIGSYSMPLANQRKKQMASHFNNPNDLPFSKVDHALKSKFMPTQNDFIAQSQFHTPYLHQTHQSPQQLDATSHGTYYNYN